MYTSFITWIVTSASGVELGGIAVKVHIGSDIAGETRGSFVG